MIDDIMCSVIEADRASLQAAIAPNEPRMSWRTLIDRCKSMTGELRRCREDIARHERVTNAREALIAELRATLARECEAHEREGKEAQP